MKEHAIRIGCAVALVVAFCRPDADGRILGTEAFDGPRPYYDEARVETRARRVGDPFEPFELLLSRSRYWIEDGHIEVVALLTPPEDVAVGETTLRVRFLDDVDVARYEADVPAAGAQMAFYPKIPSGFEGEGRLEVSWHAGPRELASATGAFRVERAGDPARSGRVPIRVTNASGAHAAGVPLTVGVPFPRGVLTDVAHLRLVDESDVEIPAQFSEIGRWSKFGTLKWVRVDFSADVAGESRTFHLEYGPEVRVAARPDLALEGNDAFPQLDAGRLRFDAGGVWFDADGTGRHVKVLAPAALTGAFVEHEDGRMYRMPAAGAWRIEEQGSEKVVLQREGWYREPEGDEFCQYEVRWVVYRDSPFARVFFTWVFTGDSDRDRIAHMGWDLALPDGARPGGFLSGFGNGGRWLDGDFLLQYDYNRFEVSAEGEMIPHAGGRAPGVARVTVDGAQVYFGARDFWQAFPSELEFRDGSLWFHNWPRHGKPRPEPLVDPERATLLDFAHTGHVLDLRLPEAYTEDPLDQNHSRGFSASVIWQTGKPETVNAQGLARTEEFWLYFAPATESRDNAARVLEGLNQETLRAVADPARVIASGAFFEAHHQDWERYPVVEEIYEQGGPLLDLERAERAGLYGMWLHGEALWDWRAGPRLYRQLRKGHGGYWRLCWLPYARSGDPRLLKHHDAAMRRMIDANFCHYVSEEVARKATGGGNIERRPGFWARGSLPWAARSLSVLDYERQPHQWWSAWHLNNYHRARDIGLRYPELAREDVRSGNSHGQLFARGSRHGNTVIKALVDSYENTFDPWLLPWAHALARLQRESWSAGTWVPYGRDWMPGDREFHRFTGCPAHAVYFAEIHPDHNYTWHLTGDVMVLRRRVAELMELEEAGPAVVGRQHRSSELVMTLGVIERVGRLPPPAHTAFVQRLRAYEEAGDEKVFRTPPVAFRKAAGEPLPVTLRLVRLQTYERENDTRTWWIYGPDGRELMTGDLSIGTFENRPGIEVEIPAEAPAGVYHLFCEMRSTDPRSADTDSAYSPRGLYFPVTPPGTPEVIVNPEARLGPAGPGVSTPGYYFHVPEGVESFTIRDVHSYTASSVRNADGEMVWRNFERGEASAELNVPPDQRGRLWRVRGEGFVMDGQIPPYYAVDPDRWFDLGPYTTPRYPESGSGGGAVEGGSSPTRATPATQRSEVGSQRSENTDLRPLSSDLSDASNRHVQFSCFSWQGLRIKALIAASHGDDFQMR